MLESANLPIDKLQAQVSEAYRQIKSAAGNSANSDAEVKQFLADLSEVEQGLKKAVEDKVSPVAAMAKLLKIQGSTATAATGGRLETILDQLSAEQLLETDKLFGASYTPEQVMPEVFGSVIKGTGAEQKMNEATFQSSGKLTQIDSKEYKAASLLAGLEYLTEDVEVHSLKLMGLRQDFMAGKRGFFAQFNEQVNRDLLASTDDGKLLSAMEKMYAHAYTNNIDLNEAGLKNQLANNQLTPENLGLDANELALLTEFSDNTKNSNLTLDPVIEKAKQSLSQGIMPRKEDLVSLQGSMKGQGVSYFLKDAGGGKSSEIKKGGEVDLRNQVNLGVVLEDLKATDFSMAEKDARRQQFYSKGAGNAAGMGADIANEYSAMYAYADPKTNTVNMRALDGILAEDGSSTAIAQAISTSSTDKTVALKALRDVIEGRRNSIDKFNDSERRFLTAFATQIGLSQAQLFDLEKAIPKKFFGKLKAIPSRFRTNLEQKSQKIEAQKNYSLKRFMERSGLGYEQLAEILKEEGFTATQIIQMYAGHDKAKTQYKDTNKKARNELAGYLVKYAGMSGKDATTALDKLIKTLDGSDLENAENLQAFVEAKIISQKYSAKAETKILKQIRESKELKGTGQNRYSVASKPKLLLSDRLGVTPEQMKKLSSMMGLNTAKLDELFTDKSGLGYAGDYFGVFKELFDPLDMADQVSRILSGTKMGSGIGGMVERAKAKRLAKSLELKKSLEASMIIDPIVGSLLNKFRAPSEAVLGGLIDFTAKSGDWISRKLSGYVMGAEDSRQGLLVFEEKLRDLREKGKDLDDMPTLGKIWKQFKSKFSWGGLPGFGKPVPAEDPVQGPMEASQVQAAPPPSTIKDTFKRAFTIDGAVANTKAILKASVANKLNMGIAGFIEQVGVAMQVSANEAIDLTAGTQIVTSRDADGLRTYEMRQRNLFAEMKLKVGLALSTYANPMGNLYKLIGNSMTADADSFLRIIDLAERGARKIGLKGGIKKLRSLSGKAVNKAKQLGTGLLTEDQAPDPSRLTQFRNLAIRGTKGSLRELYGSLNSIFGMLGLQFSSLSMPPGEIGSQLGDLRQRITSTVGLMFENIGNAVSQLTGISGDALRNAFGSVINSIKTAWNRFRSIGRTLKTVAEPPVAPTAPTAPTSINPSPGDSMSSPTTTRNPVSLAPPTLAEKKAARSAETARRAREYRDPEQAMADRALRDAMLDAEADRLLAENGISIPMNSGVDDVNSVSQSGPVRIIDDTNPVPGGQNPVESVTRVNNQPVRPVDGLRNPSAPVDNPVAPVDNPVAAVDNPVAAVDNPVAAVDNPVAAVDNPVAAVDNPAMSVSEQYQILDDENNRRIEENWDGTSDSIIKNIKHITLVSKKLGYWIMRNLSEGSPGPTFYMRQHYAETMDFIEAKLGRLVKVAQRSGAAILTGMSGDLNPLDLSDIAQVAIPTMQVDQADDDLTSAISQAEEFQSANIAAANLAANAATINDQTQATAQGMAAVAKAEIKVDQKGKKLFRFFNVMWRAMKIVPKAFVKMGQVFQKIGKPAMMMGAGFSAAGFAMQNITSNLSTLGVVNESQQQMLSKFFAIFEVLGGIGAIGGAVMQVLSGGFALVLEAGAGLIALVLHPMAFSVVGIGLAVIGAIFAFNWLMKSLTGFDAIGSTFDSIGSAIQNIWSIIVEKASPAIRYLRNQFALVFGYGALQQLDQAFALFGQGIGIVIGFIGKGLSWLGGAFSHLATHSAGVIGVLSILFAPLIAIGWLAFKALEAIFNLIGPKVIQLMPVIDRFSSYLTEKFVPLAQVIGSSWALGLAYISVGFSNLWSKAEEVGGWILLGMGGGLTQKISLAWEDMISNIKNWLSSLPEHAMKIAAQMQSFLGDKLSWITGGKKKSADAGSEQPPSEAALLPSVPATAPSLIEKIQASLPAAPDTSSLMGQAAGLTQALPALSAPVMPALPAFAPAMPDMLGLMDQAKSLMPAMPDFGSFWGKVSAPTLPAMPALPAMPDTSALMGKAQSLMPALSVPAMPVLPAMPAMPVLSAPAMPALPAMPDTSGLVDKAQSLMPIMPVLSAPAMPAIPDASGLVDNAKSLMPTLPAMPDASGLMDKAKSLMPAMPDLGAFWNKIVTPVGEQPATPFASEGEGLPKALRERSKGILTEPLRQNMFLHDGAEQKAGEMLTKADQIESLTKQSQALSEEYTDLQNPQGWRKTLSFIGKITGMTEKRTKEIVSERLELDKNLQKVNEIAKAEIKIPLGSGLLAKLGVDADGLSVLGEEIQSGAESLGSKLVEGVQQAVAPAATYWDDALSSIAEVGVGGTAAQIFGGALTNISEGVGTVGMAFKDLSGEVFESLKTMDFDRLKNAGKMFTSAMGEGLGQIARGFQDAANGAAFFAAFSVTSGFLPALMLTGLALLILYLTLKFGKLRQIASGAFTVMGGAAKIFIVAIKSIFPIMRRLGDVFKGVFSAMKGDFEPIKTAISNLKLEFQIMFAKMGPGFAQIKDGLIEMKKGFQPVIDEGILPLVAQVQESFRQIGDFFLDPIRNTVTGFKQFGADLTKIACDVVDEVKAEFADFFTTIAGHANFAIESVKGFFSDFGNGLGNIVDIAWTTVTDVASVFTDGMSKISDAFGKAWEGINIGATGLEGISKGFGLIGTEVKSLGANIFESLTKGNEGIKTQVAQIGLSFVETNKDLFAAFEKSFERIGQLFPNLSGIFTDGMNDLTAYFAVKLEGVKDAAVSVFNGISSVATGAWDLAQKAFDNFVGLSGVGLGKISALFSEKFAEVGDLLLSLKDQAQAGFDGMLLAAQPMINGFKAIFTGTVQDLDNLVQSALDSFNLVTENISNSFKDAFAKVTSAGEDLRNNLVAIPQRIKESFLEVVGSIGAGFAAEFESLKTSGGEIVAALQTILGGGAEQIGAVITGITSSFDGLVGSITSTIESLKTTFASLGETIDGAMGKAFGGIKEKWGKTTGFMGKMMGKVVGDSEESGQLILHNMAENSPGPTQRIRELYALTATAVSNSLESVAAAAGPIGKEISDKLNPTGLQRMEERMNEAAGINPVPFGPQPAPTNSAPVPFGPQPAPDNSALVPFGPQPAPAKSRLGLDDKQKTSVKNISSNLGSTTGLAGNLLELAGQGDLAKGIGKISTAFEAVGTSLDAVKMAKEIGADFQVLQGVMQGFSKVEAAEKIAEIGSGLAEAGKAVWGAITGFGQWIAAKLFQTGVGVTAETTMAGAAVAGAATTTAANTTVATSNAVVAGSFATAGAAGGTAWAVILGPITLVIAAIAALIAIVLLVKAAFDANFLGLGDLIYGIGDAFNALFAGIGEAVGGVFGSLMTTFSEIGQVFSDIGRDIATPFVELFAAVGSLFAPITALFPKMNGGLSGTSLLVKAILLPIKLIAESLARVIKIFGFIIKVIVFVAGLVVKALLSPFLLVVKAVTVVVNIFKLLRDGIVSIGSSIWSAIVSPFEFVQNMIKGIGDKIGSIFSGPMGVISGIFGGNNPATPATEVQKFATGGYVSGAGGPTDDKIPAMLSNGEFVVGAANTARNRSFLEAINSGMAAEEALTLIDTPHPSSELPRRSAGGSASSTAPSVTIENNYNVTVSFGDIVVQGATGAEAAEDFSRFLQTTEFQMAVQAALIQSVESMR